MIKVITKLPNSEQSSKGKVKTHKYINRQNQSVIAVLYFSHSRVGGREREGVTRQLMINVVVTGA